MPIDIERKALYSLLEVIESDLVSASGEISSVESKLAYVEGATGSLPSRLSIVRGRGYAAMGHLEKSIDLLTKRWMESMALLKQDFHDNAEPLKVQIRELEAETRRLRAEIDMGNIDFGHYLAHRISMDAVSVRERAVSETIKISAPLNELITSINAIERDLKMAEKTAELFTQAVFHLTPNESPVLAIKGRVMTGEKNEGTLYFTNQRFVFEGKKEVVLEKRLFIVTKKKVERTVVIEQPIGALQEISKGRIGLVAWTGVYIRFKPERRLEETPFDVKGWEADVMTRFFNYIIGGEADRDIATIRGAPTKQTPTIKVARCPHCGGPYTREIYKGENSVRCEYCGTQIVINQ